MYGLPQRRVSMGMNIILGNDIDEKVPTNNWRTTNNKAPGFSESDKQGPSSLFVLPPYLPVKCETPDTSLGYTVSVNF